MMEKLGFDVANIVVIRRINHREKPPKSNKSLLFASHPASALLFYLSWQSGKYLNSRSSPVLTGIHYLQASFLGRYHGELGAFWALEGGYSGGRWGVR